MKFEMNNSYYAIKEVSQEELQKEIADENDGYYYGQTRFPKQIILIDKDLSVERKRKTLIHELVHAFINSYGFNDYDFKEENVCYFFETYGDDILKIAEDYFN